jgi:hypothetical protein
MRRVKLGDVYAYNTERGYRIVQYAYYVEKKGRYVKVFPGFYDKKPENLTLILQGDCSYIVEYNLSLLVREEILEFWGNYTECILDTFPERDITFHKYDEYGRRIYYEVANSMRHQEYEKYIGDPSGSAIPKKYRNIRLLNLRPHTITFIYLLSSDFDLSHFDLFWPKDNQIEVLEERFAYLFKT